MYYEYERKATPLAQVALLARSCLLASSLLLVGRDFIDFSADRMSGWSTVEQLVLRTDSLIGDAVKVELLKLNLNISGANSL